MNHPLDRYFDTLLKATEDGPDAMTAWLKDLQEEVGAPDGDELPESIEVEYVDGTKETFEMPKFYSHDNPAPQSVIDDWSKDEDEE